MSQIVFFLNGSPVSYEHLNNLVKKHKKLAKNLPTLTQNATYLIFSKILVTHLYKTKMIDESKWSNNAKGSLKLGACDIDCVTKFWILGFPYIWIPGNTAYECKRMYIVDPYTSDLVVYDEDNNLVIYSDLIKDINNTKKAQKYYKPGESFCLLPIPKNDECKLVRNHFLVNIYGYELEKTFKNVHRLNLNWEKLKSELKIEGIKPEIKSLPIIREEGIEIPANNNTINRSKHLKVIEFISDNEYMNKFYWVTLPSKFANPHNKPPCGVNAQINITFLKNNDTKSYYNIYHVMDEINLLPEEITYLHEIEIFNHLNAFHDELDILASQLKKFLAYDDNVWGIPLESLDSNIKKLADKHNIKGDDFKKFRDLIDRMYTMGHILWVIDEMWETIPHAKLNKVSMKKMNNMDFKIVIPPHIDNWAKVEILNIAHINYLYATNKIQKYPLRQSLKS